MSQKLRPVLDVTVAGWTPTPSSPNTHFDKIDEAVADDNDFTQSSSAPDGTEPLEVKLTSVEDPLSSVDHSFSYRLSKNSPGGGQIDVLVELLEGATVIASVTHQNIGSTPTLFTLTPTQVEIDSITDYSNLRLRWTPTQV